MKIIYRYILCSFLIIALNSSCSKWLDAVPSSQIRNDDQFSSEEGFQQALIGCYIGMSGSELYGTNLSFSLPSIMAQQYERFISSFSVTPAYAFQNYSFTSIIAEKEIEDIWLKSYNVISNANNALKNIETNKQILHPLSYNVIKGELLAVRAFMHFSTLRLYGLPNIKDITDKGTMPTIPYVTETSKNFVDQKSYSETINMIITDLQAAIKLLESDPIIKKNNPADYVSLNINGFYNKREMRINYYAAQAILAQVYMWEGSTASFNEAKTILNNILNAVEADSLFPFSANYDKDPILSSEHLFGLNVIKITDYIIPYISYSFQPTDYSILYMTRDNAENLYRGTAIAQIDNRYAKLLQQYTNINSENFVITRKYEQSQSIEFNAKNRVPVIRISEIHLMMAECIAKTTGDFATAKTYIEKVNLQRGVVLSLTCNDMESFMKELTGEYAREFFAENQLYYIYKRTGVKTITDSKGTVIEMTDKKFVLPYPSFEIQSGRVQFNEI